MTKGYTMQVNWNRVDQGQDGLVQLRNRVSQLVRFDRVKCFKIGITGDPNSRAGWYEADGEAYDEMVVVFQTRSASTVRSLERELVDYYVDSDNAAKGGGGRVLGPPYYLYVVRRFAERGY